MKNKQSLTVSIPAYNEEQTIEKVVKEVLSVLKSIRSISSYELLLVNDGSTDSTPNIINRLAQKNKKIRVIHHKENMGFSGAIVTSLFKPKTDLVFLGPADGQFDYRQMRKFIPEIQYSDVVVAYRIHNVEPWRRKFQSKVYHTLARVFFDIKLKEFTSVTLWRKSILDGIVVTSHPRSNTAQVEIFYKVKKRGARIAEVPIRWRARLGGEPKGRINFSLIYSTLLEMWRLFYCERMVKF